MSSFLYALGKFAFRRRWILVGAWLLIFLVIGGSAAAFNKGFQNNFTIPGTEAQEALDTLSVTMPSMAYSSATVIVVAPDGQSIQSEAITEAVDNAITQFGGVNQVGSVTNPYTGAVTGLINSDNTALIIPIQLNVAGGSVLDSTTTSITDIANALQAAIPGSTVSAGGSAYGITGVSLGLTEVGGALIALIVLAFTFGSLIAAAIPLSTALLGVAVSVSLIVYSTALFTVSSTTPILAMMLGLAVGIDYALFILSRYRSELALGKKPEEAAGIATATAGSAVVFAGTTVIIALVGLFVANIPFLTVMGVAAALGVAIAVIIALTLLPALMGVLGKRLYPRPKKQKKPSRTVAPAGMPQQPQHPVARRWIALVTKVPALTIVVVVVGAVLLALPAQGLRLALPTNGDSPAGSGARVTYDLVTDYFGAGQNAPLLVTGSIIQSTDPLTLVADLKNKLQGVEGVSSIVLATPNQDADTVIIEIIPTTGAADSATAALVQRLRDMAPEINSEYGVEIQVTGVTALQIDVSNRLGAALLPFGIFVVGLSLLLLGVLFRSIWVPIKATLGYLLSVGVAFGVTALVFEDGWFNGILNVNKTGPVISFMPIIVMGVLFGLAMDYEVFLVSRMREDYVHTGDAKASVKSGFLGSAQVVTAAAVIMFSVFASFIPNGDNSIKPMAVGLAVGVFVDAFIVRMAFVPAVLTLLGKHAWWFPRWLQRIVPFVDVEGAGVKHLRELAGWPGDGSVIAAEGLTKSGSRGEIVHDFSIRVASGEVVLLTGGRGSGKTAIGLMLSGRMAISDGRVTVNGWVLPEESSRARHDSLYIPCRSSQDASTDIAGIRAKAPAVIVVDDVDAVRDPDARATLGRIIADVDSGAFPAAVIVTSERPELASDILGTAAIRVVDCTPPGSPQSGLTEPQLEGI